MRCIIILTCTFLISCTKSVVKKTNLDQTKVLSIEEIFLLLPEEAFYISETQPTISIKERQITLQSTSAEKAEALSSNFVIDTSNSRINFLKFNSFANDEGLSVSLKTWARKDKSIIVGVNITKGDMCCDYSRLKLFRYKNSAFKDVSKLIFPSLKIEDFAPEIDSKIKALFPSPIEVHIFLFPDSDFIKLSISNTPMWFDLADSLTTTKESDLKLIWKNDRFIFFDH